MNKYIHFQHTFYKNLPAFVNELDKTNLSKNIECRSAIYYNLIDFDADYY